MNNFEQQFLDTKPGISFETAFNTLKASEKLRRAELDQLREIWNFVMNGSYWSYSDLSECCVVAEKAVREKYELSDPFIQTIVNIAAYQWK